MIKLGDVNLQTDFNTFKNLYEIKYDKIIRGKRINYIDTAKSLDTANILKINLNDVNSPYSIIKTATEAVHGKDKKGNLIYEKDAVEKLFAMLQEEEVLKDTKAFKNIKKQFKFSSKNSFKDKDYHPYQIAEAIVEGMREAKESNVTNGILNGSRTFMKALEGNTEFVRYLNSENMKPIIQQIANNIVERTNINVLDGTKKSAERYAKSLVEKYYMPNRNVIKKGDKTKQILYDNLYKDLNTYVKDVVHTADKLGASISVQEDGSLLLFKNGRSEELIMPKIKYNDPSETMYLELGSMKIQVNNKLTFKADGRKVKGGSASSLDNLNRYSISNNVQRVVEKKGQDEGFDRLVGLVSLNNASLRSRSTINGFGGNDIDSNYGVDISDIKNVLVDLFGENQKLNHIVDGIDFADKEFLDNMKQHLKYYVKEEKALEDINPEMTRDLIKNINFVLDKIKEDKNVSNEFAFLTKELGFTGQEKKTSALIGIRGYRPGNSTFSIFDNSQRPPITQSGNALQLRVDDIKKSKLGITAGNTLSSDIMDKRTMRNYFGLGKTTTDVMMDTTYVSSNALQVLIDNNFAKVMKDSNVDEKTKDIEKKAYNYIRNSISTFEQERIIDSRVHEAAYGLRTASTQKLSKNYDVSALLNELVGNDLKKQQEALLNYRGNFEFKNGELVFNSSPGKLVSRGESAVKWKGFAERNVDFASKMHHGVFNFNFYESDGTKLRDEDINKIIRKNLSKFLDKNNQPLTQAEMAAKLEKILSKKGITGQYAIEDISAMGYVKTMTSGAEKGMTDIVYASTGSYNNKIKQFFKETDSWDIVKDKVITNETVDAIFFKNKDLSESTLKKIGFESLDDLKKAITVERNMHSALLFDKILKNKTHLLANDAVAKHGNIGQMYEGLLSKAINSLGKKYGSEKDAVDFIVDKINSNKAFQFIEQYDLNKDTKSYKSIGVKQKKGRFFIDDKFYSVNKTTSLDKDKFTALIKSLDEELEDMDENDRLVAKDIYIMNKDGKYEYKKEAIGSYATIQKDITVDGKFIKDAKVAIGTNTRENVKYVRDAETQTGVTAEYFEMLKTKKELKKERIGLEKQMIKSTDPSEKSAIQQQIMKIDSMLEDIDSKAGTMKTMRFGDQELSILERVSLTEAHAEQIEKMINNGELDTKTLLSSHAFKDHLTENADGTVTFSKDIIGEKSLKGLLDQFKDDQFFNPYTDELLTDDMVKTERYAHLKDIHEYAKKYKIKLGVEGAEKEYKIQMAMKANSFNRGYNLSLEDMKQKGFEVMDIKDVNFKVDDLVERNIVVDLGEKFGQENRYLAVPGTGMKIADEEVRDVGHQKLNKLKHSIEELESLSGKQDDEYERLFQRVLGNRTEAVEGIRDSIFGKNGMHHNASKIEINATAYRLKSSGLITDTTTKELVEAAKEAGIDITVGDDLTKKSKIMGKTIAE